MHPQCFGPFNEGFKYVEPNNIEEMQAAVSKQTCAVILELIQGESGVNDLDEAYVTEVAKLCKKKDILLIVDEVQTGNGRTGSLYSYMYYDISPDIVTTAKGMAGGLPMGATLFFGKTEKVLGAGSHGSTFGGNPICAAAAISILKRIDDKFLDEVDLKSQYMAAKIMGMSKVKKLTGMGLMFGIETDLNAKEVAKRLASNGLLVLTAKNKIRLLPPLNITRAEIEKGLEILAKELN
jgi:acetylornithine/N-succinyldiaminopimelate aminotransferase